MAEGPLCSSSGSGLGSKRRAGWRRARGETRAERGACGHVGPPSTLTVGPPPCCRLCASSATSRMHLFGQRKPPDRRTEERREVLSLDRLSSPTSTALAQTHERLCTSLPSRPATHFPHSTSASPAPPTCAPSSRTGAPCAPKCEGAQTSGRALSLTSGGAAAGAATSARRRRSVGESWNKKKGKEARGARARLRSKTDCASDFLRGAPRDPTAA